MKDKMKLSQNQIQAIEAAGADGRRWAWKIVNRQKAGGRVDQAELRHAKMILVHFGLLKGSA